MPHAGTLENTFFVQTCTPCGLYDERIQHVPLRREFALNVQFVPQKATCSRREGDLDDNHACTRKVKPSG
jgi:hypothetical protein